MFQARSQCESSDPAVLDESSGEVFPRPDEPQVHMMMMVHNELNINQPTGLISKPILQIVYFARNVNTGVDRWAIRLQGSNLREVLTSLNLNLSPV